MGLSMMRRCKIAAWALVAGLLGPAAGLAEPAPERINFDAMDAPFMSTDANGAAVGLYPDLLRAAFALMKVPVHFEPVPWKRALAELDAGSAGVAGIYKTRERLQKYDYSETLMTEKLLVFVRQDHVIRVAGVADLVGLRVGVIRGWSYGEEFDAMREAGRFVAEDVVSDAQNFSKLEAGRLDAVVTIEQSGRKLLASGLYPSVQALPVPFTMKTAHLAFNKALNKTVLLQRFDAAVEALRRSGEFDRIVDRALTPQ